MVFGMIFFSLLFVTIIFLWWVGSREKPVEEEVAPLVIGKGSKKKCRMVKAKDAFICPLCKATGSKRGPFKNAKALAAHKGRCKSKKKSG